MEYASDNGGVNGHRIEWRGRVYYKDGCSFEGCDSPVVCYGIGHHSECIPVDENGETAFCSEHLERDYYEHEAGKCLLDVPSAYP